MMKRMRHSLYVTLVVLCAVVAGCTDEEVVKQQQGEVRVTAAFGDASRTVFSEEKNDAGQKVLRSYWMPGDEIGLGTKEEGNLMYMTRIEQPQREAEFAAAREPLANAEGKKVYAYYPYSGGKDMHSVELPNIVDQHYHEEEEFYISRDIDFLYAESVVENSQVALNFKSLFTFLKVTIPADMIPDQNGDCILQVQSLGNTAVSLERGIIDLETKQISAEQGYNYLNYHLGTGGALSENGQAVCYIALLPQPGNVKIEIYMQQEERQLMLSKNTPAGGFKAGEVYAITLDESQKPVIDLDKERAALSELYTVTNGNNWEWSEHWNTSRPVREWQGVETDFLDRVMSLKLPERRLQNDAQLPATLLYDLTGLSVLDLSKNNLSGKFPESFANFLNMPMGNLMLQGNQFDITDIPAAITQHPGWKNHWPSFLWQKKGDGYYYVDELDLLSYNIDAPAFVVTDLNGNVLTSVEEYDKNVLTVFYTYNEKNVGNLTNLMQLYDKYKYGLNVIGIYTGNDLNAFKRFIEEKGIEWPNICPMEGNDIPVFTAVLEDNRHIYVAYKGKIANMSESDGTSGLHSVIRQTLGYESSDYSNHGNVEQLQYCTKGNGIDVVLMGDAYADVDYEKYKVDINKAMEFFFTEEPFRSLREYFNVYRVDVVSRNHFYGGETALSTSFEGGTAVTGDHEKVKEYVLKALGDRESRLSEATVIVLMNSSKYAGTCHFWSGEYYGHSSGLSISYFPVGANDEAFRQVLNHEANGHGFAKLADEYSNVGTGAISPEEITKRQDEYRLFGWNKNIDFVSDPNQTLWKQFMKYYGETEDLGAYEGGATYEYGVWRPTENSIMRYNTGGFNAPSRAAIYNRVMYMTDKYSSYTFEKFLEWDIKHPNINTRGVATPYRPVDEKNFVPLAPPVYMGSLK